MITIYHNPRCGKSREGLDILKESGHEFEEVRYLEHPLNAEQLKALLGKLGIKPIDLVRTNEPVWKENFKDKALTDHEVINAMAQFPILVERPIVVKGEKAVIGRPPEKIRSIL